VSDAAHILAVVLPVKERAARAEIAVAVLVNKISGNLERSRVDARIAIIAVFRSAVRTTRIAWRAVSVAVLVGARESTPVIVTSISLSHTRVEGGVPSPLFIHRTIKR